MAQAVLFDLYNTLVPGGDAERDALCHRQAVDLGVDPADFLQLFRESWRERCTGKLGDLTATLDALARRLGGAPTASALRLASYRAVELTKRHLWPKGPTLEALDRIRGAGWRTGLVSNCAGATAAIWPVTPLASRFEVAALSSELGVAKPDAAIFLTACAQLGVAPTDCVYVGDGADDELGAAAALGMSVVQTTEFMPPRGGWPPRRIASLTELPGLLGLEPEAVSGPPERSPTSAPAG